MPLKLSILSGKLNFLFVFILLIQKEGFVAMEFQKYISKDVSFTIRSITDGHHKVEVKSQIDFKKLSHVKPGMIIQIRGTVEAHPPGPIMIHVNKIDDFTVTEEKRHPFI